MARSLKRGRPGIPYATSSPPSTILSVPPLRSAQSAVGPGPYGSNSVGQWEKILALKTIEVYAPLTMEEQTFSFLTEPDTPQKIASDPWWQHTRFRRSTTDKGWVLLNVPAAYLTLLEARLFELKCIAKSEPLIAEGGEYAHLHFMAPVPVVAYLADLFPPPEGTPPLPLSKDRKKVLSGRAAKNAKEFQIVRNDATETVKISHTVEPDPQ